MGIFNPSDVITTLNFQEALRGAYNYELFDDYSAGAITVPNLGIGWAANGVVAGGTIVSRTGHNSVAEKRLSLVAGEYLRKMSWGSLWSNIRIIVQGRMNTSANVTAPANFAIGVCSGTANTMADGNSVDNFVGIVTGNPVLAATTNWAHNAGTVVPYSAVNAYGALWKHGATNSGYTGPIAGMAFPETEAFKFVMCLDLTRPERLTTATAVTYTVNIRAGAGIATTAGWFQEKAAMLSLFRDNDQTAIQGSGTAAGTIASVTESTGVLDTIDVWWEHASVPIEINALGVYKLR